MRENIVVSKDGFDVFTAYDKNLNFDSNNLTHKIHATGTSSITVPSSGNIVSINIPHNLGYPSFCEVWANISGLGWISCPGIAGLRPFVIGDRAPIIDFAINNTNLIVRGAFGFSASSSLVVPIRYIIFTDKMV